MASVTEIKCLNDAKSFIEYGKEIPAFSMISNDSF